MAIREFLSGLSGMQFNYTVLLIDMKFSHKRGLVQPSLGERTIYRLVRSFMAVIVSKLLSQRQTLVGLTRQIIWKQPIRLRRTETPC